MVRYDLRALLLTDLDITDVARAAPVSQTREGLL